jgi:hypothetical protein
VVLAMTTQTRSHAVFYERLRSGCLRHVTVTPHALDPGANMRRMLELDQGAWIESVDPFPWNLAPRSRVIGNFLDFWIAGSDFRVTQHALGYRWNGRARAGVCAAVTIQALQSMLDVYFMRVCDRLFGAQRGRCHCDEDQ